MALFHCLSDRSATSREKIGEKMFKMKHYIREFHTQWTHRQGLAPYIEMGMLRRIKRMESVVPNTLM
jgi:hypothetical protein